MSNLFVIVDGRGPWLTPSLVVAVLALLFTVGSFWWIQVRRGRLRGYTSHVYSGAFTPEKIVLVLPIVVHNPAPAPIIVTDLRLRVDTPRGTAVQEATLPIYLSWIASHASVYPKNGSRLYAAPFVVAGRTAIEEFIEFQLDNPVSQLEVGPYEATVQARVAPSRPWRRHSWQQLLTYTFNSHLAVEARGNLIPRSNHPTSVGRVVRGAP